MTEKKFHHHRGFTLIEIIVALVVFSSLSVMAYQGFLSITEYDRRQRDVYAQDTMLHRAWAVVLDDILHIRPRPTRQRLGSISPAYHTENPDYLLQFTRGGRPGFPGRESGLERVAYSLSEKGEFIRWSWPVLDRYSDEEPAARVLFSAVAHISFWQLNENNEYENRWPPLNQNIATNQLPRMIRFELELLSGERFERLIPGVETMAAQRSIGNQNSGSENASEDANAQE